jgi:serine/threonine protein kinase
MNEVRRLGDRYEVGALLGRGGMAEVHEGRDLRLGRRVAIKILKPDLAADPSFLARFRREAQSAAALNHPHIVAVYDTGEDVLGTPPNAITVPYIVMELVEGITLREVLASGNLLVPERALQLTSEILAALDYSHRHGIIHRDIKPANVMLTTAGSVKVMDFGIARATADPSQTATSTAQVLGTAAYLSPEQAQGLPVDARSDLYSTGVVLFELLTRRPPFVSDSPVAVAFAHVNEPPPVPSTVAPDVPASLDPLVARALTKDLSARYQTALEFRADVERAIAGVPVTQIMTTAIPPIADDATTVLSAAEPTVAQAAATGAMTPVIAGGAGAPYTGGPGPEPTPSGSDSGKLWRRIGLTALIVALVGLMGWLAFTLLSSGNRTTAVPDVTGKTVAQANSTLAEAGLMLGREDSETSDRPENTIIDQDPSSGEMVSEGSRVNVVVSAGKESVAVPDLVDFRSIDDVRNALTEVGLLLGRVQDEDSDQPENSVLRQDPAAFTMVPTGTSVDIWVSNGQVTVPDVTGDTDAAARRALQDLGFEVAYVDPVETTRVAEGSVVRQSPSGGTTAKKGSTVTLTLAKAPPPQPKPTPAPTAEGDGGGANGSGNGGPAGNLGNARAQNGNPGLSAPPSP